MNDLQQKPTQNKRIQKARTHEGSLQDLKITVKSLDTGIQFRKLDFINEQIFVSSQRKDQQKGSKNKNNLDLNYNTKTSQQLPIPRKIPQSKLQKSIIPNPNKKMFLSLDDHTFLNDKFNDLFKTNNTKLSSIKTSNSSSLKRCRRRNSTRTSFSQKTLDHFEDEY
ncbi:hypothetical protein M0813_06898 [Anaeramoeba flamelloides]|uniref:Uncharacterized protein n=1 Tax=Anaeramoeba flamelloides TaxID=1746091 RepID=A0ABQ8XC85_9EUKA|nr:hypothetical protein M0813_06898 [Anaeramoeba flamelloides]